jgi:hypothetical protein
MVAWVALPSLLGVLCLGAGYLVEAFAATTLQAPLRILVGFGLISFIGQLATFRAGAAPFVLALVGAVAVIGLGIGVTRRAPDWWAITAAVGGYVAYAVPVAGSGTATFAGYIKLDDTATYLAMLDRVMDHGRSLAGLAPSTYEATLATSLSYGYPLGSLVPLGIAHELIRTETAWLWQPYLAFLGGLVALALYALARPVVGRGWLAALIALVAAQPALLVGYSLWGGIKELATAALIPAAVASVPVALRGASPRAVIPLAVLSGALVGILSVGGVVWLAPLLAGTTILLVERRGLGETTRRAAVFVAAFAVCAAPTIDAAIEWLPRSRGFTSASELGNLSRPLRWVQVAGIWPVGDFRLEPHDKASTYILVATVMAAAAGGLAWAILARRWEIVLYALTLGVATAVIATMGSPWVGAKAYAIASPVAPFLALSAAGAFAVRDRSIEASLIAGVVTSAVIVGIAWSNVLAYQNVWLAPRTRLVELESIGERFAGQGPALMTEFEPYGARHFLRRLDAEGASELRRHFVYLKSRHPLASEAYADIDRIRLPDLLHYRTLILRRSPVESRPPSVYGLVWSGKWYEVWQRPSRIPKTIVTHLSLGTELQPGAVPSCATILRLARKPNVTTLRASVRGRTTSISLPQFPHPKSWAASGDGLYPHGGGTVRTAVRVADTSRYRFWIGGAFLGRLTLAVDGRRVAGADGQLQWSGQYVPLGMRLLRPGLHNVRLTYASGGPEPGGSAHAPLPMGPLVVAPLSRPHLIPVPSSDARALCGRRLDWVEAVRP